jgi:hypothetical protein
MPQRRRPRSRSRLRSETVIIAAWRRPARERETASFQVVFRRGKWGRAKNTKCGGLWQTRSAHNDNAARIGLAITGRVRTSFVQDDKSSTYDGNDEQSFGKQSAKVNLRLGLPHPLLVPEIDIEGVFPREQKRSRRHRLGRSFWQIRWTFQRRVQANKPQEEQANDCNNACGCFHGRAKKGRKSGAL